MKYRPISFEGEQFDSPSHLAKHLGLKVEGARDFPHVFERSGFTFIGLGEGAMVIRDQTGEPVKSSERETWERFTELIDKNLDIFDSMIRASKYEISAAICEEEGKLTLENACIGDECSVQPGSRVCSGIKKSVGQIHTHPIGTSSLSTDDMLSWLSTAPHKLECVGTMNKNKGKPRVVCYCATDELVKLAREAREEPGLEFMLTLKGRLAKCYDSNPELKGENKENLFNFPKDKEL